MYLYLASYKNDNSGVSQKITGQINAFSNIASVWYFIDDNNKLYLRKKNKGEVSENIFCGTLSESKIVRDIMLWSNYLKYLKRFKEDIGSVELTYYRMTPSNPYLVNTMKYLKKSLKSKIVKEIPTYPYAEELKAHGPVGYIKFIIDSIFKKSENKNVNYISIFSEEKLIDGIETITIDNSLETTKIQQEISTHEDGPIFSHSIKRLGMVTAVEYWQGVDRILEGISEYINLYDKDVHFDLVGLGSDLERLKQLSLELGIDDNVTFHGFKSGEELSKLYQSFDICIGPLGLYRKNLELVSSLKTKEYLLNMKPFIYSGKERHMTKFKYALKVSNDDSKIDFKYVFDYFNDHLNNNKTKKEFEKLLLTHFTWDIQIGKVLSKIKGKV